MTKMTDDIIFVSLASSEREREKHELDTAKDRRNISVDRRHASASTCDSMAVECGLPIVRT
eukprot:COSAG02_NODE_2318_length_9145_cov_41.373867_3_plen_61_part_00